MSARRRAHALAFVAGAGATAGQSVAVAQEVCETPTVPTLSEWGFIALGLALFAFSATGSHRRRRRSALGGHAPQAGSGTGLWARLPTGALLATATALWLFEPTRIGGIGYTLLAAGFLLLLPQIIARTGVRRLPQAVHAARMIREEVPAKLGRCPKCMRWSLRGTVLGWAMYAAAAVLGAPYPARVALMVAAGAFSALTVSHAVTFLFRLTFAAVAWRRHFSDQSDGQSESTPQDWDRRRFLVSVSRTACYGLLFGFGFNRMGAAVANADKKCCYKITGRISSTGCPTDIEGKTATLNCPPSCRCQTLQACGNSSMRCIVTVEPLDPNSNACQECTADYDFSAPEWQCT